MDSPPGESGTQTLFAQRYQLGERLGRRGPVRIYAGRDQALWRDVAVAVHRGEAAARERFLAAARSVAQVDSPRVVDVFDCGSINAAAFVVTERPAHSLEESLGGSLPAPRRAAVARQLAEALADIHRAGVPDAGLRLDAVGLDEGGSVRLSLWPLRTGKASVRPAAGGDLAMLAALAGALAASEEEAATLADTAQEHYRQWSAMPGPTRVVSAPVPDLHDAPTSQVMMTGQLMVAPSYLPPPPPGGLRRGTRRRLPVLVGAAAAVVAVLAIVVAVAGSTPSVNATPQQASNQNGPTSSTTSSTAGSSNGSNSSGSSTPTSSTNPSTSNAPNSSTAATTAPAGAVASDPLSTSPTTEATTTTTAPAPTTTTTVADSGTQGGGDGGGAGTTPTTAPAAAPQDTTNGSDSSDTSTPSQ